MSSEDDDPIIQEIDVYLAKSLADKLYLFQYPVRPAAMTYDIAHLSAKIKPKQQKVEVELAIDSMSPNYCRSKGEQIALNVDGTTTEENNTYSTKLMDKQTFSSIQATTNTSRYAAAVFRKGELHLTPLHGILQLRPSFSYLDKADSKHREREAANEGGDSSQDEAEEDVKQITLPPEDVKDFMEQMSDSRSEHERQYLFCQFTGMAENTELVKSPSEYLAMLMPPPVEEEFAKPVCPSNVLSMAQLRSLPLGDQVRTLMKNVKVMPFANLMGFLGHGTDSTAVLRCIQQVAMLVQGNWVIKSPINQLLSVQFPPQSSAEADEQKVFALWEMGDSFDQHRQLLLEIFMKNYRVRRNLIQGKLTQEFGDNVTKTDLDRLLKECCVSYGGMWYLKGTVQS
ncbi:UNVERIFIED_CONTAM: hypothetical protein FKN15_034462 [Acipenser sinensis]